jgi:hypothetical protein
MLILFISAPDIPPPIRDISDRISGVIERISEGVFNIKSPITNHHF